MHDDGTLNLPVVSAIAGRLVQTGVRGAFVVGTTGEGQSLTVEERMMVADAWAGDDLRKRLELIVHVGHNCQRDAIRLAAHAADIGMDKIALHAPTWFRGQSLASFIEFCEPVAAAAKSLPFYLYDIPAITGVTISAAKFLVEAKPRIPNLAGLKYTNPDCITLQECLQARGGAFEILWGSDEILLSGIAYGAAGAVGSTYNFAAPLYRRILRAIEASDWATARVEQAKSVAMVRALQKHNMLAAMKFAMKYSGIDCGPVRPPLEKLTPAAEKQLINDLETIDFLSTFAA